MATFDASRPIVAAMAVGVGRAALDCLKEELAREGVVVRYDAAPTDADRARARRDPDGGRAPGGAAPHLARRLDDEPRPPQQPGGVDGEGEGGPRRHEDHAEGGRVARAARLLASSCCVEKWMRDAKINDIYEGTQQINLLIVARRILDYSSSMLR